MFKDYNFDIELVKLWSWGSTLLGQKYMYMQKSHVTECLTFLISIHSDNIQCPQYFHK